MLFNLIRPIIYIYIYIYISYIILYCVEQPGKDETGAQVQASNYAVPRRMDGTTTDVFYRNIVHGKQRTKQTYTSFSVTATIHIT